ncbi:Undecaprenyl-diphosphatase [compost metagenome]
MPTMLGAFTLDLYKNRDALSFDDGAIIAVGFVAAFVSGLFVVRSLLDFVSKRGFAVFAWWRIVIGTLGLIALLTVG